jgi:pentatricopeptide repeat protein
MNKIVQPFLFFLTGAALAYYGYRVIRDAWDNPPEDEDRKLILGYYEDGSPIFGDDCDVDKTLEMWKDMSRRGIRA